MPHRWLVVPFHIVSYYAPSRDKGYHEECPSAPARLHKPGAGSPSPFATTSNSCIDLTPVVPNTPPTAVPSEPAR